MTNSIDKLKSEFIKAKKSGWIEVEKGNYGVIGTTFEKIVGVTPNDFQIPDFENIELKTKSGTKFKSISLFNCVPTGPHYHEVEIIKDSFGYPDLTLKEFKVFNGDVYGNKLNKIGLKFHFKLDVLRDSKRIILSAYDSKGKKINASTYWDFDILEEKLTRKLPYLALIDTEKKFAKDKMLFKYNSIKIYKLKGFDSFIDLLERGIIKITFKINVYKDQKRFGKIHDRGTAFSIEEKDLEKLFDLVE